MSSQSAQACQAERRSGGKVKRALMEVNDLSTAVTIERDQGQVYAGSKRVATCSDGQQGRGVGIEGRMLNFAALQQIQMELDI